MWRDAYRGHTEVCTEIFSWLYEQDDVVDPGSPQLHDYRVSLERIRPVVRRRRGPRLLIEAFDREVSQAVIETQRVGPVLPVLARAAALDSYLTTMTAYALFRPWILVPAMLAPTLIPALVLLTYPDAARVAMAGLPPAAYFVMATAGIIVNAALVQRIVQRFIDRPHLFGPYPYWAIPPALASFILVFAAAYWIPSRTEGSCMSEPLTRVDAVYFSLATFTTTGFGDIAPVTGVCRGLASIQMAVSFILVILGVAVFVSRASSAQPAV